MGKHSAGTSTAGSSSTSTSAGTGNTRNTSSSARHAASGQTARDAAQIAAAATTVNSATSRGNSRGAKPSTTRKAVGGAAAGAATGAAVGSVVPGVGTAIGAGAGAVLGGAGGAWRGHSDKKAWKKAGRSGSNRALLAEFLLCLVIVALSPSVRPKGEVSAGAWMKRGSAVCALFILLGMLASVGPRTSRVSVAFGGLITLGLVVSEREVIGKLLGKFAPSAGVPLDGDGGDDDGSGRPPPDAPTDPDDRSGPRPPPDGPYRANRTTRYA